MGGGVGISVHGSFCIATERTMLAMPETGLGLVPDVGGGWFLPRLTGEVGMYLALTGDRLKAAETCVLGITKGYIPSEKLEDLVKALADNALDVDAVLAEFFQDPGPGKLDPYLDKINDIFAKDSVEDVLEALEADGSEWALPWHRRLLKKAPTSMKVTFEQIRRGRDLESFRENMKMEYRIVNHTILGHDFYEGVRAILIDKDNNPKWSPASLTEVSDEMVARHFESLGENELEF
ncbi:MAG: enoyl-CoA hydratase/isomerase family protein, partial [Alphaproteobacteria bacterium]